MTKNEMKVLKMNIMGGMCEYVKENCSPANQLYWATAIGHDINEELLEYYATNDEEWVAMCHIFAECCELE